MRAETPGQPRAQSRPKGLIIGLDGATFTLIDRWAAEGELPSFSRLMAEGVRSPLRSTFPPMTAPAWISMATGLGPARHGLFDFINYRTDTYGCRDTDPAVGANYCRGKTIWDLLGKRGWRVGVFGVPMTYPAWPLNGEMIAEVNLRKFERHFHPAALAAEVGDRFLAHTSFYDLQRSDITRYGAESLEILRRRAEVVLSLYRSRRYDFMFWVTDAADRAQHLFWRHIFDESSPHHDVVRKHYRLFDRYLGRLMDEAGPEATLCLVSDHGFGPNPATCFNVNHWLASRGWLKHHRAAGAKVSSNLVGGISSRFSHHRRRALKRMLPGFLVEWLGGLRQARGLIEWGATAAYHFRMATPVEGIVINVAGRQKRGCVPAERLEGLRAEIAAALAGVKDEQGHNVVRKVYLNEEIYEGPFARLAPDIVFELEEGYQGGTGLDSLFGPADPEKVAHWSGVHRMHGVFAGRSPGFKESAAVEGLRIQDVVPNVLTALGEPLPEGLDGRVMPALFRDEAAAARHAAARHAGPAAAGEAPQAEVDSEEQERLKDQLRGLGYID